MQWLVVVLAFGLLGLGVVALAFGSGGRRRRRKQTSAGRQATALGLGVARLLAALGLPALMLALNDRDQAKANAGVRLTAAEQHGRELFALNCAQCHTLSAANAVGKVGPNLDTLRPPPALVLNAIAQGRAQGRGQMPPDLLTGEDARDVAAFVARTSGR